MCRNFQLRLIFYFWRFGIIELELIFYINIKIILILLGWVLWKGILTKFVPIGICLVAVMEWRALRKHSKHYANKWEIDVYCTLPLRSFSRCWGWLSGIYFMSMGNNNNNLHYIVAEKSVPISLRPYIFGLYANTFGVDINEAQNENLKSYNSLSEFFVR